MPFFQFIPTTNPQNPLFEPTFLNVEFFFNLVPHILQVIVGIGVGDIDVERYRWIVSLVIIFLWIASVLLVAGIIYVSIQIRKLIIAEKKKFVLRREAMIAELAEKEENKRWEQILELMTSSNESDWRLAILEADNILGEILERQRYEGESIGDRLKGAEVSDFTTLSQAWEAHKVRNQIAHEGLGVMLSKREADRVIDLYRQVFEEFHYI